MDGGLHCMIKDGYTFVVGCRLVNSYKCARWTLRDDTQVGIGTIRYVFEDPRLSANCGRGSASTPVPPAYYIRFLVLI
jgi:hypothetical protein